MAIYRVEAPDKSIIRIEGPDNATPEQLASAVQAYAKSAAIPAAEPEKPLGIIDSLKESITGNRRATDTTNTLPDWVSMPEMQNVSLAGLKAALGTMASNPKETAQIMQANFPNVQVSQDEKGNYVFTSAEDGKRYALKPGFQMSDIPRAIGTIAAFTPAGSAKTLLGAAVKSGATQTVIEGTQAATGGEFNPAEVGVATALGPIAPALGMAASAGKNFLRRATDKVIGRAAQEVPNPVTGSQNAAPSSAAPVERAGVSSAAVRPSLEPFDQHAAEYVAKQPVDKFNHARELNNLKDDLQKDYMLGNKDSSSFFEQLQKENKAKYFDEDGDLTDAGNKRFVELQDDAIDKEAIEIVGEPKQNKVDFSNPEHAAEALRSYLDKAGLNPNVVGGSGKSSSKYFSINNGKQNIRISDHELPDRYQNNSDIEIILPKDSDEALAKLHDVAENLIANSKQVEQIAAAPAKAPPAVEPLAAGDLAATAKKAAEGGRGSVKATEVLAEQAAPDAKIVAAAQRLGFSEYLQPDHVSSNQAYRELSQVLKSVPGSQIGAQSAKGLERAAAKSDELIEKLGGSKDLSEVGAGVKGELQATHDTLKASAKKLYDEIDSALVQKAVPAPAPTVVDFVRARAKTLGGEENLTAGEKIILRKLAPKETQKPNSVEITQPTYALLDQVRKQIGAAKRGAQNAFGNADSKLLGDLEAALRADQGAVAKANGFGEKWQLAQATAKQYKGLQDDMVSLFGKNLDRSIVGPLGTAVKSLPSGDVERLVKLINLTPESLRGELVASGMLAAFKKNAVGGQLNFNTYAKWYEGLLNNKRAHAVVMSNLPKEARKQLSDLYRVSKGITLSEKEYIATGRLQTGIDAIKESFKPAETLIDRVYDVARRGAVGAVAGTVVTPVLGPGVGAAVASALTKQSAKTSALKAADELIASQAFADAVKAAASKGANSSEVKKKAVLRLAYSAPFKKLVKELNNPKEMSNPEKWILQSLEASNQSKSNQ